jgi:hypothetical protein
MLSGCEQKGGMFERQINAPPPVRLRSWAANLTLLVLGLLVAPVALFALIWVLGEMGLQLGRQGAGRLGAWFARHY